ncbi:MAG: tRNA 2-selenouridine(34) synthase MnmH [Bdellovibrionota bacterium]
MSYSGTFIAAEECIGTLLSGAEVLDVRSPSEHHFASIPGMVLGPIMDDAERHEVGICFQHDGQSAAIELGHRLVAGEVRESRVRFWIDQIKNRPISLVCCARGGLRSQIAQQWLAESGVSLPRVRGGYKALRNVLIESADAALTQLPTVVVAGKTGSGKTELLRASSLRPSALDLEQLADHCGSAFGALYGAQPSQSTFENRVCMELIRIERSRAWMLVEDESSHVGKVRLVPQLTKRIGSSPIVVVECPFDERVERILNLYVAAYPIDEAAANPVSQLETYLLGSLQKISERLGGARAKECGALIEAALQEQRNGRGAELHRNWIAYLLREYYDPMYDRALERRSAAVLFSGPMEDVVERLHYMLHLDPQPLSSLGAFERAFE